MYILHIGNKNYSSWSLRPWILMTQLAIAFQERQHVFGPAFAAKTEGKSPSGKVPCLHDDGLVIWDSLAIAEYLAEKHPGVWPKDEAARAWARSAAAEMHSGFATLRDICSMSCGIRMQLTPQSLEALRKDLTRLNELWCDGFARFGGPFLAGREFGAVDAFFCPVAFRVQSYLLQLSPASDAYAKRLLALPGMKKWYEAALAEPWIDAEHEVEIGKHGKVVQELRKAAKATA